MTAKIISIPASTPEFDITRLALAYREEAVFKDTYGGAVGWVSLGGFHFKPKTPSDTVLIKSRARRTITKASASKRWKRSALFASGWNAKASMYS